MRIRNPALQGTFAVSLCVLAFWLVDGTVALAASSLGAGTIAATDAGSYASIPALAASFWVCSRVFRGEDEPAHRPFWRGTCRPFVGCLFTLGYVVLAVLGIAGLLSDTTGQFLSGAVSASAALRVEDTIGSALWLVTGVLGAWFYARSSWRLRHSVGAIIA